MIKHKKQVIKRMMTELEKKLGMKLKRIISKNIKSKTNSNKKKIRAKININTYQRTQLHFCCVHMPPPTRRGIHTAPNTVTYGGVL